MSLPIPTIKYSVNGGVFTPLSAGASALLTVGTQLTLALQSNAGVATVTWLFKAPGTPLDNASFAIGADQGLTLTITIPVVVASFTLATTTFDGAISSNTNVNTLVTANLTTIGPILGKFVVSPDLTVQEDAQGRILVPASQTVDVYTLPSPSMADQETVILAAHAIVKGQSSGAGEFVRLMRGTQSGGSFANFMGGTSDTDATLDPTNSLSASLAGFTCQIVPNGSTLVVRCRGANSQGAYVVVADSSPRRFTAPGSVAAPTIVSVDVSSGPGAGGTTLHLVGTGFTTAASVMVCGTAATFTPPTDDTHLTIQTGAFFGLPNVAGSIVVQNASASASLANAFTYTSTLATTPSTILGSILRGQYENTSITQSGGIATGWTDLSGLGNNLTAIASPIYNASSGSISPAGPTVTLNGSTQWFTKAAFALGGTGFFSMVVCRATASTNGWAASFSSNLIQLLEISDATPGHYGMANSGVAGVLATFGSSNVNQTVVAWGYTDHAIGAGNRIQVGVNTTSPISTSGTSSAAQSAGSGTLTVGGNSAGFPGEMVAAVAGNALPSSTQLQLMFNYYHGLYGT